MIDLILKYPALRSFIKDCFIHNEGDKLFEFLMEIQADDSTEGH